MLIPAFSIPDTSERTLFLDISHNAERHFSNIQHALYIASDPEAQGFLSVTTLMQGQYDIGKREFRAHQY